MTDISGYTVERIYGPDMVKMWRPDGDYEEQRFSVIVRDETGKVVARTRDGNCTTFCSKYGTASGDEASDLSIIDALVNDESIYE